MKIASYLKYEDKIVDPHLAIIVTSVTLLSPIHGAPLGFQVLYCIQREWSLGTISSLPSRGN